MHRTNFLSHMDGGESIVATKTGIQWTEVTWNPTTGCDRISTGQRPGDNAREATTRVPLGQVGNAAWGTNAGGDLAGSAR